MDTYPLTVQRRIAWGECDPARIYYTPRVADYAVEAVEVWYEKVLQVSWVDLVDLYNLDASFVWIDCEIRRPLVASQSIQVRVWVVELEYSSLTFTVVGEGDDGEPHFQVSLVACLIDRKDFRLIPIPPEFRERIGTYRDQCANADAILEGGNSERNFPGKTIDVARVDYRSRHPLPQVDLGVTAIFSRQRRVVYRDCDASGRIYTPRVFDYAVEVIGEWYEEVPCISWMDLVCKRDHGAPFVATSCEYLRPMVPGQSITLAVRVTRLGGTSIGFSVVGYDAEGEPCFDARLAACFIDQKGFKPMRIPEEFRQRIEAYQAVCEAEEGDNAEEERDLV